MAYEFTLNRRKYRVTREQVIAALRGVRPSRVHRHSVEIAGRRYPVKQAFAAAFGLLTSDFTTGTARQVLRALGFPVLCPVPQVVRRRPEDGEPAFAAEPVPGEAEDLVIGAIRLQWSRWYRWHELEEDCRGGGGVLVPRKQPGVYEAKRVGAKRRLIIGKAVGLSVRVKYGLVNGTLPYLAGRKIELYDDISRVRIRWACTSRPAAAEEELHQRHLREFGCLPTYTRHT